MSSGHGAARGAAARMAIGVALLAFVVWWVGIGKVAEGLARIHPLWLFPIFGVAYVGIAISCVRWRVLLAARGIAVSVHRLVFYYIMGYFFSSFLPGMFGGDIVRSYVFGKRIRSQVESFASVFMERLSGLVGLVAVAAVASLFNWETVSRAGLAPLMAAVFAGFVLFLVLLFNRPLVERLGRAVRWRRAALLKEKVLQFHDAVCSFRSEPRVVAKALAYSVLFQLFTSVNTYVVCLALGLDVRFLDIMVVVPIILLICTVPVTPSAIGVWEVAFTLFFSRLGLSRADAANIALVLRGKNIVVALLGGVFYALSGRELRRMEGGG
ncbi:MAG: lysylphosphatidylglycerol synthase transmembrane domain-containing protein [bacterium]|nr:lysylphosphatidylglycerol synthase transmembrane domain-containing protein [bacterium]